MATAPRTDCLDGATWTTLEGIEIAVKAAPFLLVLFILVGGVVAAFQTFNTEDASDDPVMRPTVTPRPHPTSPPPPTPRAGSAVQSPLQPEATPGAAPMAVGTDNIGQTPSPSAIPEKATPVPTVIGQPSPEPVLRVGNTDGIGVYLRRTPRMDDRIRPWQDGTPMVVVGPRVSGEGRDWEHVRAPDGTVGYLPAEYLVGVR